MAERDPADGLGTQVGVGNLESEPDGKCDVREVNIVGLIIAVEVDLAAFPLAIVGAGVAGG